MPILVLLYCYFIYACSVHKASYYLVPILYIYGIYYYTVGDRTSQREVTHVYRVTHYIILIYDFITSVAASASGPFYPLIVYVPFMLSTLFYESRLGWCVFVEFRLFAVTIIHNSVDYSLIILLLGINYWFFACSNLMVDTIIIELSQSHVYAERSGGYSRKIRNSV